MSEIKLYPFMHGLLESPLPSMERAVNPRLQVKKLAHGHAAGDKNTKLESKPLSVSNLQLPPLCSNGQWS